MERRSDGLLSLPDEVLMIVSNQMESDQLRNLTMTCRRLFSVANDILYRHSIVHQESSVLLWAVEKMRDRTFEQALTAREYFKNLANRRNNQEVCWNHVKRSGQHHVQAAFLASAATGRRDWMDILMDHGADVNMICEIETNGSDGTSRFRALQGDSVSDRKLRFPVSRRYQGSALHVASEYGRTLVVRYLLDILVQRKLQVNPSRDDTLTALDLALMSDNLSIARLLIESGGRCSFHSIPSSYVGMRARECNTADGIIQFLKDRGTAKWVYPWRHDHRCIAFSTKAYFRCSTCEKNQRGQEVYICACAYSMTCAVHTSWMAPKSERFFKGGFHCSGCYRTKVKNCR